jgi:tetratricopeptide (TPR) repeat protein
LLDDFVVERMLGEGGMGKVYLLRSRSIGSRFAVKRAKSFKQADRRNFLAELQTWIDLPEHANLVPCRFFRTVGDEVLIFAEYVEGGSLKEWIDSRRLYEGGTQEALARMLDVAIQFAWGLHCLHELGLVHQDVKPGNVLMGRDEKNVLEGVSPRVTDYGLARARAAAGETFSTSSDPSRSIVVSSGGGTPAYWSPEQAAGLPLTRKTDIWSWGVSVLEIFTGEMTWISGQGAAEVLEQHLRQDRHDEAIPAMPGRLSELLRQCFCEKPGERPTSLGEVADRLKAIYRESVGIVYSRTLNAIERAAEIKDRRTRVDPQEWLWRALRAAGRDPAEAVAMVDGRGITRQGKLVAEIAVYEDAKQLYCALVRDGRKTLEQDLAKLCCDKAVVHETAADVHGALQEYDQAIAIRERLVNQEGRSELANDLAALYMNKANALGGHKHPTAWALGDTRRVVALYDQALAIRERLVNQEGRWELADALATTYASKAAALRALGETRGAVALYDQALAIRERLVNQEGRWELANYGLGGLYASKAAALKDLGDTRGAVALYDREIAISERLVKNQEGGREVANGLATAYMSKASALYLRGDKRGAVALYDQAIAIYERLVNQEGGWEPTLQIPYLSKALALRTLGDHRGAVALYDKVIAISERLVKNQGGRWDQNLAGHYMNKASALRALGDNRGAVALYDQALVIYEGLINQEGRCDLVGNLAPLKAYRGAILITLGKREDGLRDLRAAESVLSAEIARTGRADLKQTLKWVEQQLAQHSA